MLLKVKMVVALGEGTWLEGSMGVGNFWGAGNAYVVKIHLLCVFFVKTKPYTYDCMFCIRILDFNNEFKKIKKEFWLNWQTLTALEEILEYVPM